MSEKAKDKVAEESKEEKQDADPKAGGEKEPEIKESAKTSDEADSSEDEKADTKEQSDQDEAAGKSEKSSEEDEDMKTKYMRLMADFQNYKRRSEKERSEIHAYANEKIVTDILEVMDNFERALAQEQQDGFREGVELIFNQLNDVLQNAGLREIEAEDKEFDPNYHNAVMMEDTDKVDSGKVSCVLQKGYTLNGKVIRASMVKVAN